MGSIERQEQAIEEMMEARTSTRREARHRGAVARRFLKASLKVGYTMAEARQQLHDVYDMYELRKNAEEGE